MAVARKKRTLLKFGVLGLGVVLVALLGIWWIVQSDWLREQVRERMITEVERTTGGRVELGSFDYNWQTLTAEFKDFVVHGTEPADYSPLLRVASFRVTLKIISLFKRDVDIASMAADKPQVHVLIRSDGSTNIPPPRRPRTVRDKNIVEQLLNLKVQHFELNDGSVQLNDRRVPLVARGEGLSLSVGYVAAEPSYAITLSSQQIRIDSERFHPGPVKLALAAAVERDQVTLSQLTLTRGGSNVQASGEMRHFAQPLADLHLTGTVTTKDLVESTQLRYLRGGQVSFRGLGHYEEAPGFTFTGKFDARQVNYEAQAFTLNNLSAISDIAVSSQVLSLKHLAVKWGAAKFDGEADIARFRDFTADGRISGLTLATAAAYITRRPVGWSGVADGHARATATLANGANDFAVKAEMQIARAAGGIPVSGFVNLNYQQRGNDIEFGQSQLNFTASQVSFSGRPAGDTEIRLDSADLEDLRPLTAFAPSPVPAGWLPVLLPGGGAHFDGGIRNLMTSPQIGGKLSLANVRLQGQVWQSVRSRFNAGASGIDFESLDLMKDGARARVAGLVGLTNWTLRSDSPVRAAVQFQGLDLVKTVAEFSTVKLPIIRGVASGSLRLNGTVGTPQGSGHFSSDSLDAYGNDLNKVKFDASLTGDSLQITHGEVASGQALLVFSGSFEHSADSWEKGRAQIKADSNGFPLASLSPVRNYFPGLSAQAEIHLETAARITPALIEPLRTNGTIEFRNIALERIPYGNATIKAVTQGQVLNATLTGDLRQTQLHGDAQVQLVAGSPLKGELRFDRVSVAAIYALAGNGVGQPPVDGYLQGGMTFDGSLRDLAENPERMRATLAVDELQLSSLVKTDASGRAKQPDLVLRNTSPIVIDAGNGEAVIRSFEVGGKDTSLKVTGSLPYGMGSSKARKGVDIGVNGSVNLQILHMFEPNVESAGVSTLSASIAGTLRDPAVSGTLSIKNASFFPENFPNGLSAVNGTVTFNRNRATLQTMTAKSGGGELSLGGFVSFGGGQLVYHLEESAQNVRVRYAGSVSVTANSSLRLSGTSSNSILSGTLTVSKVVFNPNTDVGNLLAGFGAGSASPTSDNPFVTGMRLDVAIESAPNLQLSTALSRDVEAEINLRLRGSPDHPVLLGSLSANQGDIKVFGTKYSINRGEVNFLNSVKMEPVLDLDLETQARGITVDITISGTFSKLNINYRSDPPLQPSDIIALLTVGHTPGTIGSERTLRSGNDVSTLQSGANTVLGAAISPVSNRLSRLFGITNIKIDPLVEGITNTPQARLTLEQQISKDITVTYITNLSQTSEQIFRLEWALSRQFSVVALRDDNGEFGIDFQYKKRFK